MSEVKLTKALAEIGRLRAENAKYARWLGLSPDQSPSLRAGVESAHEMRTLFCEQQAEHIRSLYQRPLGRSTLAREQGGRRD